MEEDVRASTLDRLYREVHATMLCHQSHTLGLFPRGKSGHARVRDNVYCATALWCLSVAYRSVGDDKGRTHELEQSAVKCMRGILFCYMRQADKVERFKHRQSWEDALHARFDCYTGDAVTRDNEWGHLQIDGTSLFLLMLAQMTASGLRVIYTMDEVDFIQNLVYYVERAYRIPDYGMWERGSRDNVGKRELHASSIGMTKAALEAMNGLNLFGTQGSSLSVIHVDPDAQYRNRVILNNLLPRESSSKETDASLLCITGYPAFAIDDSSLCELTEKKTCEILEREGSSCGFKRFLRDGHHTVREDPDKRYYDVKEITQYEGIECEWPLFYCIIMLSELSRGNKEGVEKYWKKLEKALVEVEGIMIVPRLYFVPESELNDDLGTAASMVTFRDLMYNSMEPMLEAIPFQWAQSLHLIARLAKENLVSMNELDPLGLHSHHTRHNSITRPFGFKAPSHDVVIQVALISETTRLQSILATHGIPTQTRKQVEPIKIKSPGDVLMKVFARIGANKKLGLSGRPNRPIGALGTSKIYKIMGQLVVFYPTDSMTDFYTVFDVKIIIHQIKFTLTFLNLYWNMSCKPTVCLYLTENRLQGSNFSYFVNFLAAVKQGEVGGVKVRLERLQALMSTSYIEHLEFEKDGDQDRYIEHKLSAPLRNLSTARLSSVSSEASLPSAVGIMDDSDVFTMDHAERRTTLEKDEFREEIEPDFSQADVKSYSVHQIKHLLKSNLTMLGELYLLHELIRRDETVHFDLNNMTALERVEDIYLIAGERKHWKTVRLAAAILGKVVDTLAPAITGMLVTGKEVTIGVFGYPEHVISEPLSPKALVSIIYDNCLPYDPIEAVLQQEIIIYLGVFISSTYTNTAFDNILRVRIGWIIQAMKKERARILQDEARRESMDVSEFVKTVHHLAPYEVMQLLIEVLHESESRLSLDKRQLNGALNCVPRDFYRRTFAVLEKVSGGIQVRGRKLLQVPTVHELVAHEKGFALKVEELLSNITQPEYRQVMVELLMVVSTVLERNPELNFSGTLDLDEILKHAQEMHRDEPERRRRERLSVSGDRPSVTRERLSVSGSDYEDAVDSSDHGQKNFYSLNTEGPNGTISFMARAVVNKMLKDGLQYTHSQDTCTIC